jgi:DNA repair protein RecO (recombination protein O)
MRLVTTDAIVLRTYNLAESDRIVLCLTRTSGLVRGVAKGARRMKSRFGAALEPFTQIRLAYHEKENRELVSISSTEIIRSHFELNAQPEVTEVIAYMSELVTDFAPPHQEDELLFRMVTACVEALAEASRDARAITRYFEIWLLRLAGLFPALRTCVKCDVAFEGSAPVFVDNELASYCAKCRTGTGSLLPAEVITTIRASQQSPPGDFAKSYQISDQADAALSNLTHRLITRALDRRPRTVVASAR